MRGFPHDEQLAEQFRGQNRSRHMSSWEMHRFM